MFSQLGDMNIMLCVFEKSKEDEFGRAGKHPITSQGVKKGFLHSHKKWLKIYNPNKIEKCVCNNANPIHAWNRFMTSLGEEKWYRNRFDFPDEGRDFFGYLLDNDL